MCIKIRVSTSDFSSYTSYEIQPYIEYGFIDYNGNKWCDEWVNTYNRYTDDINSESWQVERDLLLDNRHKFFIWASTYLLT